MAWLVRLGTAPRAWLGVVHPPQPFMAKSPAGSSLFNRGPLFQEPPSPPKDEGSTPPTPDGGSTTPVNAEPPAGSLLLFGALADSGKIKQRKNGSYRMVLDGVDEFDWFTDRKEACNGEGVGKEKLPTQVS